MHASQKSYHNYISERKVLDFSPSFGKGPDEVAPEQLTAVELVTFMPLDNQKYIKDIEIEQVTGSPWVSQNLGRDILRTAVKYVGKIVTRAKIETKV